MLVCGGSGGGGSNSTLALSNTSNVPCTLNGESIADGASVFRYKEASVPANMQCAAELRTCSAGVLSGTASFKTCTVQQTVVDTRLSQNRPAYFPAQFGTALARPRYNPYGAIQTSFLDGAYDAFNTGFSTLKIWAGPEVWQDPSFYFFSDSERNAMQTPVDVLNNATYQKVLSIPFKTVVFEVDTPLINSFATQRLTQSDLDKIYQDTYAFARALRSRFNGSGRTFIIQNHEGDWHIDSGDSDRNPTAIGLLNYADYWRVREDAIQKARADEPSNVQVYHLCEVARVRPSLLQDKPSLARDVLPKVACDLVGYSTYEVYQSGDATVRIYDRVSEGLNYIRTKALPSPVFGTHQAVVSEIGIAEQVPAYTSVWQGAIARGIVQLLRDSTIPYVLFWTMYDNECTLSGCSVNGGITTNVPRANLLGFWVRTPDGTFGNVFSRVQTYLSTAETPYSLPANKSEFVTNAYQCILARQPDQGGFAFWVSANTSFKAFFHAFFDSAEYTNKNVSDTAFVNQVYQCIGYRTPSASELTQSLAVLSSGQTRAQFLDSFIASSAFVSDAGDTLKVLTGFSY